MENFNTGSGYAPETLPRWNLTGHEGLFIQLSAPNKRCAVALARAARLLLVCCGLEQVVGHDMDGMAVAQTCST